MRGQRKVRIATQAQPFSVGLHQVNGSIDPRGRPLVRGGIARAVDQVEHLLGVGQRHDQRSIAPHTLVGDVHPRLLFPMGRRHRAIHVDVGDRTQQIPGAGAPQRRAHRVDALHQFNHVRFPEATREVTRRGRIGDQVGAQGIHVGRVMSQALDVFQPRAAAQHVVSQIQHVIRLMIRQMHLQQLQRRVDGLRQAQLRHQPMDRPHAAVTHHVRVGTNLVVHPARAKHRFGLRPPVARHGMSRRHLVTVAGGVTVALFYRYSLHRKDLLRWGSEFWPNPANSNYGKSFRSFRTQQSEKSRLAED